MIRAMRADLSLESGIECVDLGLRTLPAAAHPAEDGRLVGLHLGTLRSGENDLEPSERHGILPPVGLFHLVRSWR